MAVPKTLLPLLKTLLPLLLLAVLANGQASFKGTCPLGQAVERFSPGAVGEYIWYGYSSYVSSGLIPSCSTFKLVFLEGTFHVLEEKKLAYNNTDFINLWDTGIRNNTDGYAGGSSKIITLNGEALDREYNFEVLHASFDILILRWCADVADETGKVVNNVQIVEVMTLVESPDEDQQKRISVQVNSLKLDVEKLHKVSQENCTYGK